MSNKSREIEWKEHLAQLVTDFLKDATPAEIKWMHFKMSNATLQVLAYSSIGICYTDLRGRRPLSCPSLYFVGGEIGSNKNKKIPIIQRPEIPKGIVVISGEQIN